MPLGLDSGNWGPPLHFLEVSYGTLSGASPSGTPSLTRFISLHATGYVIFPKFCELAGVIDRHFTEEKPKECVIGLNLPASALWSLGDG